MKIQSCSLPVTLLNSLLKIMIPLRALRLSLLEYISEMSLDGWRYQTRTEYDAPDDCLFFSGAFEEIGILTLKKGGNEIIFLDTYLILDTENLFTQVQ